MKNWRASIAGLAVLVVVPDTGLAASWVQEATTCHPPLRCAEAPTQPVGSVANSPGSIEPDWALFRRNSENELLSKLVDPDSAKFVWPYGFQYGVWKLGSSEMNGWLTCGLVNARNRMGGYTGQRSFVVIVDYSGLVKTSAIGTGGKFDLIATKCRQSSKDLPVQPPELADVRQDPAEAPGTSIADQIQKLVELKNSGALTEEEFQVAKRRILEGK